MAAAVRRVTSRPPAPPALISIHYIRYYAQRPLVAFCDVFDDTHAGTPSYCTSNLFPPCDGLAGPGSARFLIRSFYGKSLYRHLAYTYKIIMVSKGLKIIFYMLNSYLN